MREWLVVAAVGAVVMLAMGTITMDKDSIIPRSVIGVSAECKDGMYSTSKRDRGTCSSHGGVRRWIMQ